MLGLTAGLLCGAGLAAAGPSLFPVPDPYRWDESFTVRMPQLDDEHRGLFNGILLVERENNADNLAAAVVKYHDHFAFEEDKFQQTMSAEYVADHLGKHAAFLLRFDAWTSPVPESELTWAKNWLVQHIKNTDFQYVDLLPHHVPKPYIWDDSVEVFVARIDEEHKVLFDHIREVGHQPLSSQALTDLKFKMRAHFDYESGLFCNSETYQDCEDHKAKHNKFYQQLYALETPVPKEAVQWAANWLVQHIKNTDFQYKFKLNNYVHEVPRPYVWQPWLQVFYEQLDDEHIKLFEAIRDSVEHPDDQDKYDFLYKLMEEHFQYEQSEFVKIPDFEEYAEDHINKHNVLLAKLAAQSVPLDCDFINFVEDWLVQHIANTDFAYRGHLQHEVPQPYSWEESFMTFYQQIDEEHKGLFDCIQDCATHPADAAVVASCKSLLRNHFDYEEFQFCAVPNYDCQGHYLKHYNFQTKFQEAALPLSPDVTDWAKNWLVQHIKNTDFAYRGKLDLRRHYVVPDPYVWDKSFTVEIQQMDDEHVLLFNAVRAVEAVREDQAVYNAMVNVFNEHFRNEEALFSQIKDGEHDIADHRARHLDIMNTIEGALVPITEELTNFVKNWLAQHIKNTDFDYRGKMPSVHPIPEPFAWDSSFAVMYPEMDTEHVPLFTCVAQLADSPADSALLASCLAAYQTHFSHEIRLLKESSTYPAEEVYQHENKHNAFLATMSGLTSPVPAAWLQFARNWLTQHIKNTDFRYRGLMPHPVSDPWVWDESFQVNYVRLDDEHKVLFDVMQQLGDNPDDVDLLNLNRDVYRDHFDYEEKQFLACGEPCDADAHKRKHDVFFKTLTWVTTPVSLEYVTFAKNWLTQHIKNTDFKYKYKLATQHKTPEPYVWNTEFAVKYDQLDSEHVGLFAALLELENNPTDQAVVDSLQSLMRDHFYYEEAQFCDSLDLPWDYCSMHKRKHVLFSARFERLAAPVDVSEVKWAQDWLAQHIKNTDFGYKGHLKHAVPEPYVWEQTFATDYNRLDDEHDVLFAQILAVSQAPDSQQKLDTLIQSMKAHFAYEEQRFCAIPNFNCVDHKMKHYRFGVVLYGLTAPVDCEQINWAKNWLAQHIKNTDHQYKTRMVGPDSGENFSGPLP